MRNRTACPNCGTEVDGTYLGYGQDEYGERTFGCHVCVTALPSDLDPYRSAVVRAASHVLGTAFTHGRIGTEAADYADALGEIAEEIAERAVKDGFSPGHTGRGKS